VGEGLKDEMRGGWPDHRPGRLAYALTAIAAAVGLCVESGLTVDGSGPVYPFLIVLTAAPLVFAWAMLCFIDLTDSRSWGNPVAWASWLGIPLVVVLVGMLGLAGVPRMLRVDLSRPSMNQAADLIESGQTLGAGWIGLYPIDAGSMSSIGPVLYVSGLADDAEGCGLARVESTAFNPDFWLAEDEGEGWWIVCPRTGG